MAVPGVRVPRLGFAGNYVIPDGALGQGVSTGHRPNLIPTSLFDLLVLGGTLGAVLLALMFVPPVVDGLARLRPRARVHRQPGVSPAVAFVGVCAGGYALCYAAAALLGLPLYDRYALPIVGFSAVLLARDVEPSGTEEPVKAAPGTHWMRVSAACAAFAVVAGVGVIYTFDSASFDAVRWNVSEAAVHAGWPAATVAGNFEWVNYHARVPGTRLVVHPSCVRVVIGRTAAGTNPNVVARGTYRPPLHHPVPVLAVRTKLPCLRRSPTDALLSRADQAGARPTSQ